MSSVCIWTSLDQRVSVAWEKHGHSGASCYSVSFADEPPQNGEWDPRVRYYPTEAAAMRAAVRRSR